MRNAGWVFLFSRLKPLLQNFVWVSHQHLAG